VATLLARRELLPLAQVDWMPDMTKTGAKDGAMPTFFQGGSQCCLFQLVKCLTAHQAAGAPITNFLTRPLAPCRSVFAEKALTSAAIGVRFKQHLHGAGVYRGQTIHGTRRGSMQHAVHHRGWTADAAGQQAQIRTGRVVKTYLDRAGHIAHRYS
jgi:hypothetical protein